MALYAKFHLGERREMLMQNGTPPMKGCGKRETKITVAEQLSSDHTPPCLNKDTTVAATEQVRCKHSFCLKTWSY